MGKFRIELYLIFRFNILIALAAMKKRRACLSRAAPRQTAKSQTVSTDF